MNRQWNVVGRWHLHLETHAWWGWVLELNGICGALYMVAGPVTLATWRHDA